MAEDIAATVDEVDHAHVAVTDTAGNAPREEQAASEPCFVVGIGASAGGQEALEQLFSGMPVDCGLSFVVIMHLPPQGPSFLADMLSRYTTMEVMTARDGMRPAPNRVQVIPAGVGLTISDGRLRLEETGKTGEPRWAHHPIDRLFVSLAAEFGERAIAVLLSGYGSDGTLGATAVREAGGTVMVQDPDTAVNPPMPRSAIAAGAASLILSAEEIPARIAGIAGGSCPLSPGACRVATMDEEMHTLFGILKQHTGHDFSSYKSNTIMRRIERRMAVNDVAGIGKYVALLKGNPQEAHALCRDILIGVTSFFRDPEAFDNLRQTVIPQLLANRHPEDPVRIWHACCASGEEVYSMAMLIREYLEEHQLNARIQLFASDIDDTAIAQARAGLYGNDIADEVGENRLNRFFTRCEGGWQVVKSLREMVVFAHHSLIKDPPFSRLDLLVCRNFLIYLTPDMQKRLVGLFHQALKPGGVLFLGSAESVGHHSDLFTIIDNKWKIFCRGGNGRRANIHFPFTAPVRMPATNRPVRTTIPEEQSPASLAEKLLIERYSPPCVVVNEKYETVHVTTRASRFLEVPLGEPTRDILRMAREELRPALRAAIYKAFIDKKPVAFRGVKLVDGDAESVVSVLVEPLPASPAQGNLAMVVIEPAAGPELTSAVPRDNDPLSGDETSREMLIRQLEEQLRITHEQLQATTEQLESSNEGFMSANEELMSINEEFQSANEELQSTNEELETSKEELHALNEELVTVNTELQHKVEELNKANSDMNNLLASSEIATVFLDRKLRIKGFTPAIAAIFNLIPSDIGRPFQHLAGKIDWPALSAEAGQVLVNGTHFEREVTSLEEGRCYLQRLLPYRTGEGRIDGVIVTFIDISDHKRLEERTLHLASVPHHTPHPVLEVDFTGRVTYCNPASHKILEDLGLGGSDCLAFLPPDMDAILENWDKISDTIINRELEIGDRVFNETVFLSQQFGLARLYAFDITKRKRAEQALMRAKQEWERTFDSVPDLIAILDDNHRILRVNQAMARRLGVTPEECIGRTCYRTVHGSDQPPAFCPHLLTLADGKRHEEEVHEERLGGHFIVTTTPLLDENGQSLGTVHVARDITKRKQAEDEVRRRVEELRLSNEELERFNRATVGRELRMVELKKEINELCRLAGQEPRYALDFEARLIR